MVTAEECSARLSTLEQTKLYSFVGVSCQATFNKVRDLVGLLKLKRQPLFPAQCPDFLAIVKQRFAFFCVYEEAAGSAQAGGGRCFARAAIAKYLSDANAKVTAGEPVTLKDVHALQVFAWLLKPAEEKNVNDITKAIMGKVIVGARQVHKTAIVKKTKNDAKEKAEKKASVSCFFK